MSMSMPMTCSKKQKSEHMEHLPMLIPRILMTVNYKHIPAFTSRSLDSICKQYAIPENHATILCIKSLINNKNMSHIDSLALFFLLLNIDTQEGINLKGVTVVLQIVPVNDAPRIRLSTQDVIVSSAGGCLDVLEQIDTFANVGPIGCEGSPVAWKCAVVSRWACRKRRRKNSPCMREDVVIMAGRKEMFWLSA